MPLFYSCMRKSTLAGEAYPASERALRAAIEECFNGERGPGSEPTESNVPALGAIVPHDEIEKSGQAAAWSYHALRGAELFILIAQDDDEDGFSMETWQTPLGEVRAEQQFLRKLSEMGSLKANEKLFDNQRAIELQLPFLQFIGDEGMKIVPLVISKKTDIMQLALDLKELLLEVNKKVGIVAISNLTRNGRDYGRLRFTQKPQEQIYEFDKRAIEVIKGHDADAFATFVEKELANFTGSEAIELLLRIVKKCEVKLEQYYTSADLSGDYRNSASYASIVFGP